jgi:hypothetical protein
VTSRSRSEAADAETAASPETPPGRGIHCNQTLNLRTVKAIGYDMDHTLVHYRAEEWERRAFHFFRAPRGSLPHDPV